jgi:hypothetical protein
MRAGRRLRRPRGSPYVIALTGRIVLVYRSRALPASRPRGPSRSPALFDAASSSRRQSVRSAAASARIPTALATSLTPPPRRPRETLQTDKPDRDRRLRAP